MRASREELSVRGCWVVKLIVTWVVKEDPYLWKEDGDRERLDVLAGEVQGKVSPAVKLLRTLYKGGTERSLSTERLLSTERSLSTAPSMGWHLMGAPLLRAVLQGQSHLPPHTAHVWQWWHCFGPAAGVGNTTGAVIAVNILGKAPPESSWCWDEGLRWGWEGACSGHCDSE